MTWRFEILLDGAQTLVVMRDVVIEDKAGLVIHQGLGIEVDLHADCEDEARNKAVGLASLHCTALSITTRAPVDSPTVVLIYEITPGKTQNLDFAQSQDVELQFGKAPAPGDVVSKVQQALLNVPDPSQRQPILLAAQMYAAALREIEPVLRFIMFWPACEALDRPLRRVLHRRTKDRFWGLKALAECHGESPDLVEEGYEARNNLFHAEAGVLDDLVERTRNLGDRLEALIAPGLLLVLNLPAAIDALPSIASSNHPTRLTFRGRLSGNPTEWPSGTNPHVEVTFETKGMGIRGKGTVQSDFKLKNAAGLEAPAIEFWGPLGPNLGQVKFEAASVVHANGTEENLSSELD